MIDKRRKLDKKINELSIGETYTTTDRIEDKDLLLYLGLTNDANPLYIQHDYASMTPYKQPIVPSVLLFGIVSSMITMHLPGPGSHIVKHEMTFPKAVYHESEVTITIEVIAIDHNDHLVSLSVMGFDSEGNKVLQGKLNVSPAYEPESINARSLENFF